jgi:hypothetical protein
MRLATKMLLRILHKTILVSIFICIYLCLYPEETTDLSQVTDKSLWIYKRALLFFFYSTLSNC